MEDQAIAAPDPEEDQPEDDAIETSESVDAAPAGVDLEASESTEGDEGPGGAFAAAFASIGLSSPDQLEEVLTPAETKAAAEATEAEAAEAEAAEAEATEATETAAEPEAEVEVTTEEAAPEEKAAESETEEDAEEEEAEDVAADTGPASPYDLPGDWYVIHSYSGYENKVKANLETRIHSMHMEGEIFDVVIPMEDVVEIKGGRKVTVPKKVFPGYILVRLYLSDDSWFAVRNTPGVTGFVGSGTKPVPLSRREVERILGVKKAEAAEKAAPRFQPAWGVGETVRVVDGPFADFNGVIEEINLDQSKVRVLVNIFGRETPVELNFEQIVKL